MNTVDNDINIYVKLGEEYKEPGYKVFNSQGQDLNNKVTITGRVDTNKKGNYKLTYSVKDSNAVLVSATRTVIVMDSEIGLSLDNDEYTNKDVEINVKVIDGYFEYMILPDGKRVDKNIYSYTVSENGEYKFTIYNKKGMSKTNSIKVSNIDKVAPTGSCSGSYSGGKSTINISAKDNIEISKYVLNTVSYNQNKIVVNGEIKTANITIYDKAGNSKSISCTLKDENKVVEETPKEEPKEEPKENPLDSIYTSSNSHKNSINGIRYMLYDQADPRWGKKKYTDGKTIAEKGCLLTAIAVISSSANSDITPLYIFNNKISINYYMMNAIPIVAGKDNFSCIVGSITKNNVVKDLSSGKVGIIKVEADSIFTASQHYMSLIDISSDGKQIFIGNSYGGGKGSYNRTGWFDIKTVLTDVHEYVVCTPTQKLINKFK